MGNLSPLPPLSLYIHLPWCIAKCPYCDFHSLPRQEPVPEKEYVAALLTDFAISYDRLKPRPIHSIFFGGGTPSLFSGQAINEILSGVSRLATFIENCEITLEANPGTLETKKFADFQKAGVNRLSIGIQSLNDPALKRLGRIHDAATAHAALAAAATAGFRSFNADLMYGLPDQTVEQARDDVQAVLRYAPDHLSLYELTIEAHTPFAHNPPALPTDTERAAIETQVRGLAAAAGFERYEVSAYAQPGKRCLHNLNYWQFGDYLGLGAGAHGKLSTAAGIEREVRIADPNRYMRAPQLACTVRRPIDPKDLCFEFALNALRLQDGFTLSLFTTRTGVPAGALLDALAGSLQTGLLTIIGETICTTARGQQFLDTLLTDLLPEPTPPHSITLHRTHADALD